MVQRKNQLGIYLLQWVLRVRKAELLTKQGGLGGIAIRRRQGWKVEIGRVDQRLGFLNKRRPL